MAQVLGTISSCLSVGFFALSGIAAQLLNALGLDGEWQGLVGQLEPSPSLPVGGSFSFQGLNSPPASCPLPGFPRGQLNSRPETAAPCRLGSCRSNVLLSHSISFNSPGITPIL